MWIGKAIVVNKNLFMAERVVLGLAGLLGRGCTEGVFRIDLPLCVNHVTEQICRLLSQLGELACEAGVRRSWDTILLIWLGSRSSHAELKLWWLQTRHLLNSFLFWLWINNIFTLSARIWSKGTILVITGFACGPNLSKGLARRLFRIPFNEVLFWYQVYLAISNVLVFGVICFWWCSNLNLV